MTNHPNRSKKSSHEVTFDAHGVKVDAEYLFFTKSGRLSVWLNGEKVIEWDWVDYDPSLFTDDGLKARAQSELKDSMEFNADPINEVPATVVALVRRANGA